MQPGKGQFHFRLHTGGAHEPEPGRAVYEVLQQLGLPDPCFAPQNQGATLSAADIAEQAVKRPHLGVAVQQHVVAPTSTPIVKAVSASGTSLRAVSTRSDAA